MGRRVVTIEIVQNGSNDFNRSLFNDKVVTTMTRNFYASKKETHHPQTP